MHTLAFCVFPLHLLQIVNLATLRSWQISSCSASIPVSLHLKRQETTIRHEYTRFLHGRDWSDSKFPTSRSRIISILNLLWHGGSVKFFKTSNDSVMLPGTPSTTRNQWDWAQCSNSVGIYRPLPPWPFRGFSLDTDADEDYIYVLSLLAKLYQVVPGLWKRTAWR